MTIRDAEFPADLELVRELFCEYADSLGVDLCFQGFEEELASLPGKYAPPRGALLLAGELGCVALRPFAEGVCEMKRLFVRPLGRGSGIGRHLAVSILDRATRLGYESMVLDTLESLSAAIKLYGQLGFDVCEPYYDNPLQGVVYMRRPLSQVHSTVHE